MRDHPQKNMGIRPTFENSLHNRYVKDSENVLRNSKIARNIYVCFIVEEATKPGRKLVFPMNFPESESPKFTLNSQQLKPVHHIYEGKYIWVSHTFKMLVLFNVLVSVSLLSKHLN